MNREWYNIDVKQEVLDDIDNFLKDAADTPRIIETLRRVSVRDMMDISFISTIEEIKEPMAFSQFVRERYIHYRGEKYGQEGFWEAAANERIIGYNGAWYEYITNILMQYCSQGDKVLFVGTADGKEIPDNQNFEYYALEQLGNSVSNIDAGKVAGCYEADFEDETFIIGEGHTMKAIVALRCLMPNTRMNYFLKFIDNNLTDNGVLIISHPMAYLNVDNEYKALPDCETTRKNFDKRLHKELLYHNNMKIIHEEETNVEYFYIIKVE